MARPGPGGWRHYRDARLVLEGEPGTERHHGPPICGQVPFIQSAPAASSRHGSEGAGTWQIQSCRLGQRGNALPRLASVKPAYVERLDP